MKKHGRTFVIVNRRKVINCEGQSLPLFYFWLFVYLKTKNCWIIKLFSKPMFPYFTKWISLYFSRHRKQILATGRLQNTFCFKFAPKLWTFLVIVVWVMKLNIPLAYRCATWKMKSAVLSGKCSRPAARAMSGRRKLLTTLYAVVEILINWSVRTENWSTKFDGWKLYWRRKRQS